MPNETGTTQDNTQPDTQGTSPQATSETQVTWAQVLETLPEDTRALYESHTHGLRSALESERNQRRDLAAQMRDASSQLEAGSEARKRLEQLESQLEEAQRRADFATEATGQGVANIRLAYLAAQEFDAFDRRGNVQWDTLREQAPELFRTATPPRGNAGDGTAAPGQRAPDIDSIIRAKAGVRQ